MARSTTSANTVYVTATVMAGIGPATDNPTSPAASSAPPRARAIDTPVGETGARQEPGRRMWEDQLGDP